ncbi:MAG: hypothetical protein NWF07_02185 [Candidatus Bathyarchaeota archaeon]|nr:hypothetical protein [Candidatus Bathyarchaeota archaeon]
MPRWAELQIIILESSLMAPSELAASAVENYLTQDKGLINHFLIVQGTDVNEAKAIVASLRQEAEASQQRQQRHILESPLSDTRVQKFKDDYLKSREEIGATEKIFKYYGSFKQQSTLNHLKNFGFNKLVHKGPFVDGSNWSDIGGWEFAVAEERYLLNKLHACLTESTGHTGQTLPTAIAPQPDRIFGAAKQMVDLLGNSGQNLIILAAHLDIDVIVSLNKVLTTPRWELGDELRTNWILGKYEDCPVLHLGDSTSNCLYVVDIPRFAALVQYDPKVDLQVLAIDEAAAKQILENNPDLKLDISTILSKVHLFLYQSYEIQVLDQKAVWSTKFSS